MPGDRIGSSDAGAVARPSIGPMSVSICAGVTRPGRNKAAASPSVEHSRFEAAAVAPASEDQIDLAVQAPPNVFGRVGDKSVADSRSALPMDNRRRATAPGRPDGPARGGRQSNRAPSDIGNAIGLGQHERQRAGPKTLGEPARALREARAKGSAAAMSARMYDQRMSRAALAMKIRPPQRDPAR